MMINQANAKNENVEGVDLESIENKYWVEMAEALERLKQNDDFKKVILEGYFQDKAIKGVSMISAPYTRANNLRGEIIEMLAAISSLEDYFLTIKSMGTMPVADDDDDDEDEE